jgi:hypothetical protein
VLDAEEIVEYKWLTINEIRQLEDLDIYTRELLKRIDL